MFPCDKLCRLCGQYVVTPNSYSVFIPVGNETIDSKIKRCLNISISKEDSKPKRICRKCLQKVIKFLEFMELCHETNQRLDYSMLIKNTSPAMENLIEQQTVIVTLKNGVEMYQNESVVVLPLEDLIDEDAETIEDLNQSSSVPIENKSVTDHFSKNYIDNSLIDDEIDENYSFNVRNSEHNLENATSDCRSLTDRNSNDDDCQTKNGNLENTKEPESGEIVIIQDYVLQNGYIENRKEPESSEIIIIDDYVLQNGNIENAKETESSEAIISEESVMQNGEIGNAKASESVENQMTTSIQRKKKKNPKGRRDRRFKCPHCDKAFRRKLSLNNHIDNTHFTPPQITCPKCDQSFRTAGELVEHNKSHSQHYQCQACPKVFVEKNELLNHMDFHHRCRSCGKAFATEYELYIHLKSHVKYKCKTCHKSFDEWKDLRVHMKTHNISSAMLHSATKCTKRIRTFGCIKNHIMNMKIKSSYVVFVESRTMQNAGWRYI